MNELCRRNLSFFLYFEGQWATLTPRSWRRNEQPEGTTKCGVHCSVLVYLYPLTEAHHPLEARLVLPAGCRMGLARDFYITNVPSFARKGWFPLRVGFILTQLKGGVVACRRRVNRVIFIPIFRRKGHSDSFHGKRLGIELLCIVTWTMHQKDILRLMVFMPSMNRFCKN